MTEGGEPHIDSTELSWFAPGPVPLPVSAWFAALPGRARGPETREDWYLRLSDAADLGIKLREGRIEIKRRLADAPSARIGATRCLPAHWRKWGATVGAPDASGPPGLAHLARPPEDWIPVCKTRGTLSFWGGDVLGNPVPGSGARCVLELAEVEALGNQAWRIGLECNGGAPDDRLALMLGVARLVLEASDAPNLAGAAAIGYPAWLAGLSAEPV